MCYLIIHFALPLNVERKIQFIWNHLFIFLNWTAYWFWYSFSQYSRGLRYGTLPMFKCPQITHDCTATLWMSKRHSPTKGRGFPAQFSWIEQYWLNGIYVSSPVQGLKWGDLNSMSPFWRTFEAAGGSRGIKAASVLRAPQERRGGPLDTGGEEGDWQRNPEQKQTFKVSLQRQQGLPGGRRCGGQVQGRETAQLPAGRWESILSGL